MKNVDVAVVDFGSQYNQLIVRKIREQNVSSKLETVENINELIKTDQIKKYKALVFSGGPNVITDNNSLKIDEDLFNIDIPVLGICYGMQLLSNSYGGNLEKSTIKEYGKQIINITSKSEIFHSLSSKQEVWMSHGWEVNTVSDKIEVLAKTKDNVIAAIKIKNKPFYGVQFHPEVTHTVNGQEILKNFLKLAKLNYDYQMANIVEEKIQEIQEEVGDSTVICGLSGGVDSSVTATLIQKAIGNKLQCIFIDNGLLRLNETELVINSLKNLNLNIKVIDAKNQFLNSLKGVQSPEEKRKIIGQLFVEIFEKEAKNYKDAKFLAQGTLYTDIIESGTKTAQTIKTHHNVGGLPEKMNFKLLEPLKTLFKDEVRVLGQEIGLDENLINRQPFPGPGLSIRIIGEVTKEKIDIVKKSDHIFNRTLKEQGLYDEIWQSFAVLTNTKTVGVKGDERSYEYVLALRAITSVDGMTAKMSNISLSLLQEISTKITNEVPNVNRVVYDITNKPPSTIEWE